MKRLAFVYCLAVVVTSAPAAEAAYPGQNGRIAFQSARTGDLEIYSMNPDGSDVRRLTNSPGDDRVPAWSADGQKIAFASDRSGSREIHVMNADGSGVVQVTNDDRYKFAPAWSPDGARIAFYAFHPELEFRSQINVMNADGTGQVNISNIVGGDDFDPAWSPDGSRIAFWARRSSDAEIWVMNADGSGQTRLTTLMADDVGPDWSSDGELIAFTSTRPGYGERAVWVMNPDGTGLARIAAGGGPSWSPDGAKFVFSKDFLDSVDRFPDVFTMNVDGTDITNITQTPGMDTGGDWQPLNRPPDCSAVRATPASLGAPNHRLLTVTISGATDPDGDSVDLGITGVTQDEPMRGPADAVATTQPNRVRLRAERDPKGDGRVYRIAFEASDGRGGTCTGFATAEVRKGTPAVDSAPPSYDSFGS